MNTIILSDVDTVLGLDTTSESFLEFCSDLDTIGVMMDQELYMEEVESHSQSLRHGAKVIKRNTRSTTSDVVSAYGNVVDGGSKLVKSVWDLTMRAISLSTRVLGFLLRKISLIPSAIISVGNKVGDIPEDIRNKIRGNITLYITVDDLSKLYNDKLFAKIDKFISLSKILSEGETWGTFFGKRKTNGIFKMNANDMKICRDMDKIYEDLKLLEFKPTTIDMNDATKKDKYFGSAVAVNFVDLKLKRHESTYYEALQQVISDIKSKKLDLKKIQDDLGGKYETTLNTGNFVKLDTFAQGRITSTIQMMSKIISVIGNIVRYINIDIATIDKATDALLKKQGVKSTPVSTHSDKKSKK